MKIPTHGLRICLIVSCLLGFTNAILADEIKARSPATAGAPEAPMVKPQFALEESAPIGGNFDGNVILFLDMDEAHVLAALKASTNRTYVRATADQEKALATFQGEKIAASVKSMEERLAEKNGRHDFMKMTVVTPSAHPINQAPVHPSITGPSKAMVSASVEFEVMSKDPEGNEVAYGFDWNCDGVIDQYTSYVASGEKHKVSHVWTTPGNQTFEVYARDSLNGYSQATDVTITIADEKVAAIASTPKPGS